MKRKKNKKTQPAPPSFWTAYWYCWKHRKNASTPARRREYWGFWIPTYLLGVCIFTTWATLVAVGKMLVLSRTQYGLIWVFANVLIVLWWWGPLIPGAAVNARRDLACNRKRKYGNDTVPECYGYLLCSLYAFFTLQGGFFKVTLAMIAAALLICCRSGYSRGRRPKKENDGESNKERELRERNRKERRLKKSLQRREIRRQRKKNKER